MSTTGRSCINLWICIALTAAWASAVAAPPPAADQPPHWRSPLTTELLQVQTETRVALAQLGAEFAAAADPATAQALADEIARVKADLEIRSLKVRLKFARAEGQDALATDLAAMLAASEESAAADPYAEIPTETEATPDADTKGEQ